MACSIPLPRPATQRIPTISGGWAGERDGTDPIRPTRPDRHSGDPVDVGPDLDEEFMEPGDAAKEAADFGNPDPRHAVGGRR